MSELSESWERVRRRYALVEDVLADVGADAGSARAAVALWREQLDREYGGDGLGGLLRDVQHRWQRALDARLDVVLDGAAPDAEAAVARVCHAVTDIHPASRLLLDTYPDHPALAGADERHRQMLLAATGVEIDDVLQARQRPHVARRVCRANFCSRRAAGERGARQLRGLHETDRHSDNGESDDRDHHARR